MYAAGIIYHLEDLNKDNYRHEVFAVECSPLHLNGGFLDHLVLLDTYAVVVSSIVFTETVAPIVNGIGK